MTAVEHKRSPAQPSAAACLFSPLSIRGITLKNRIAMSPMCQYSSEDGCATQWHLVHLGSRAVGGCALVMVEATAVEARGRISPEDMGLWRDGQIEPLSRCAAFIAKQDCLPAIQLAHAGRKACTRRPWEGGGPIVGAGQWQAVAPSPIPFAPGYQTPHELTPAEIGQVAAAFTEAARRAVKAGFQVIELHAAHGYLLHEFLSPLSNARDDEFGGSLQNRMRFPLMVAEMVRAAVPGTMPLFMRISATDYAEAGGWDLEQSIILSRHLKQAGIDLIDCSSGGTLPQAPVPTAPGYQVPFAKAIKEQAGILTGAVGLITKAEQANAIIEGAQADVVLLGRELLREPYWALHAARALGTEVPWPVQYHRAKS